MKKVLVSLLVLVVAVSGVFAAVNFSGNLVTGYQFQYDQDKWTNHIMGQDGDDSNTTKLNLGFSDDNGIWSVTVEGILVGDGRVTGDLTVDFAKIFAPESDWSAKLSLLAMDEVATLRAYHSVVGKNFDRIRTNANGIQTTLTVGYGDLVQVQVGGTPVTVGLSDGGNGPFQSDGTTGVTVPGETEDTTIGQKPTGISAADGEFLVSAMTKPIDGLAISAGYILNGKSDDNFKGFKMGGNGLVAGALDVNLGTLIGLGFDLGVSASDKYALAADSASAANNLFAATVYGGTDLFDLGLEYGLQSVIPAEGEVKNTSFIAAKANLYVLENLILNAYFGAWDLVNFGDSFFVGGEVGYVLSGITFKLGIEYSESYSLAYDNAGLVIIPSIGVSF